MEGILRLFYAILMQLVWHLQAFSAIFGHHVLLGLVLVDDPGARRSIPQGAQGGLAGGELGIERGRGHSTTAGGWRVLVSAAKCLLVSRCGSKWPSEEVEDEPTRSSIGF